MNPLFKPTSSHELDLDQYTFDELIEAARAKAINDASKKLLAICSEEFKSLQKKMESESFIRKQLINHIELKLKAAKNIK